MRATALLTLTLGAALITGAPGDANAGCQTCFETAECTENGADWTCEWQNDSYGCCEPPGSADSGVSMPPIDSGAATAPRTDAGTTSPQPADSGVATSTSANTAGGTRAGSGAFVRRDDCACVTADAADHRAGFLTLLLLAGLTLRRRR